jgi:hypothetical protein
MGLPLLVAAKDARGTARCNQARADPLWCCRSEVGAPERGIGTDAPGVFSSHEGDAPRPSPSRHSRDARFDVIQVLLRSNDVAMDRH